MKQSSKIVISGATDIGQGKTKLNTCNSTSNIRQSESKISADRSTVWFQYEQPKQSMQEIF